ncbi:MAG: excinuclease ABC subunit UvrC [Desulfuromonadales bacterium]|nr:excinuclease ABC subunit UvrC [Desulfuromonadales bacterium]
MLTADAIKYFPTSPGVYLMKDGSDKILYVGKAINLKKRVSSYFSKSKDSRYQIRFLMNRVIKIDWIVTDTEKEALILENNLIKEHKPRYNLDLRDDKTYFSIRLNPAEEFPRLTIIRKPVKDGARYFGPYSSAQAARDVLKELYRIFPLIHYPIESCRRKNRPCLYYQMKQCSAPCFNKITQKEYAVLADGAGMFLSGKNSEIVKVYREKMATAAQREAYEEASRYRDLIKAIEKTVEKQKVANVGGNSDVIGLIRSGDNLQIGILFIRNGLLMGNKNYFFSWELDDNEGLFAFLNSYYNQDVIIPEEILIPRSLEETKALAEILSEKHGRKVLIFKPQRGEKLKLLNLAEKNAENALKERLKAEEESETLLQELKDKLHLSKIPKRIECYDISNLHGSSAVGSQVTFIDGKPCKGAYRRYRIKTIDQSDDFGMLEEVFSRRFKEGNSKEEYPDLIIVDGGIGQLNALINVINNLNIAGIDLAGLAKSRVERDAKGIDVIKSDERVFLPGRKNPVVLKQNSPHLLLLARIRDEAHRFAITYHRSLRNEKTLRSVLDGIKEIGAARRKALLQKFGSVNSLKRADIDNIASIKGITAEIAEKIKKALEM